MRRITLTLLLLACPLVGAAQSFELTPMVGYRWGGEFLAADNDLFDQDMDVDDSSAYALLFGVPLNRHMQIELLVDRQQTSFGDTTLFGPAGNTLDVDVTYYHVGYVYQWTPNQIRPYVTASLGVASLSPDVPGVTSEDRFSVSLGGGVKIMVSEHVLFRLDGRFFWTDTGSFRSRWDDHGCDSHCWEEGTTDLVQNEIKVGVGFLF